MKKYSFTIKRGNKTVYTFTDTDDVYYHINIIDDMIVIKEVLSNGDIDIIHKFSNF